jgi:phosphohistidine phosphatase SixA
MMFDVALGSSIVRTCETVKVLLAHLKRKSGPALMEDF